MPHLGGAFYILKYNDCLYLKQQIDNCFFKNLCYNKITPVIKLLEVLLCNLI